MTTTAPIDPITSPELEGPPLATFLSNCLNYKLVVKPQRRKQVGETGEFFLEHGNYIEFRDGRLVVPADRQDMYDFLKNHPEFGRAFYEMGRDASGALLDDSGEVTQRIVQLTFAGDFDAIADILLAELNGKERPSIIKAAEAAIEGAPEPGKA